MSDRGEAQRRVHQIDAFREELARLTAAQVVDLTAEQRQAIAAYHDTLLERYARQFDVDRSTSESQLSRGMRLASFFAAATLTAAIYSLVGVVWGRLDFPMQATLLCLFPLAALIGVELSARRERTLYVASLFAVVAYGTFWLAVKVVGDLVNIPLTPFVIWAGVLFGLALALPYGFRLILAGALVALVLAVGGSMFQAAGIPWNQAVETPDVVTGTSFGLLLLAPHLARVHRSFAATTRLTALILGFLGLLTLSTFGEMSLLPASNWAVQMFYQVVMLVAGVAALVVGVRCRLSEVVRVAATALTIFLLVRFVDWFWDALPAYVFFFVLAALAFGWLLAMRRIRTRLSVDSGRPLASVREGRA
jgi:hypothetical protein